MKCADIIILRFSCGCSKLSRIENKSSHSLIQHYRRGVVFSERPIVREKSGEKMERLRERIKNLCLGQGKA
jgi:hypothetical protein